jgi:hypothetical protein
MPGEAIPDWHRVTGAFANQSPARGACAATVGTLARTCSCCGNQYIVIAAIAEDGAEISVALPLKAALDVAESISTSIERLIETPVPETLN